MVEKVKNLRLFHAPAAPLGLLRTRASMPTLASAGAAVVNGKVYVVEDFQEARCRQLKNTIRLRIHGRPEPTCLLPAALPVVATANNKIYAIGGMNIDVNQVTYPMPLRSMTHRLIPGLPVSMLTGNSVNSILGNRLSPVRR